MSFQSQESVGTCFCLQDVDVEEFFFFCPKSLDVVVFVVLEQEGSPPTDFAAGVG